MVNLPLTKCIRRELSYQSLSTRTVKRWDSRAGNGLCYPISLLTTPKYNIPALTASYTFVKWGAGGPPWSQWTLSRPSSPQAPISFLSSTLTFFVRNFLVGFSSISIHFDRALSLAGHEPTRLKITALRPGQGTVRTYQGLPAGFASLWGACPSFTEGGEASLYVSLLLSMSGERNIPETSPL